MPFVLDASVTISWAMPDEEHSIAERAFREIRVSSAVVPGIWWYEVRNILVVNERRGRISQVDSVHFLSQLQKLDIQIDHQLDSTVVMDLARTTGCTVYDAAYLAIALRDGLPLATIDKALRAAATSTGIPLLA